MINIMSGIQMYICTCVCMYTTFSTVLTYQKRKFPLRRYYARMVIKGSLMLKMGDEIKKIYKGTHFVKIINMYWVIQNRAKNK